MQKVLSDDDLNLDSLESTLDSLNYKYEVFKPKILVFGVGGGGVNAVNSMADSDLSDVDFVVANTDYQSLESSRIEKKILLGKKTTNGMGAGADPFVGKAAAEENLDEVEKVLDGISMVFITAGMGGGTGTGAAPVIAKKAKEMNILVASIVTKPFSSEGSVKMQQAEKGIEELRKYVDTLIIVPNQNLFRLANQETRMQDSLKMVDNVLKSGVKGITDLITKPGFINLDFADVKTVMKKMGKAMMGTGEASGPDKAIKSVEEAISNPLLDNVSIKGAKGIIINITGSPDITLFEHEEATKRIKEEVGNEYADIIIGNVFEDDMEDTMRVSIFATGIDDEGNDKTAVENRSGVMDSEKNREQKSFGVGMGNGYSRAGYEDKSSRNRFDKSNKINKLDSLDILATEEDDGDFYDMSSIREYDEYGLKNGEKLDKNHRSGRFSDGGKNEKKGFFSSFFGRSSENSAKVQQNTQNISDMENDDLDIDVKLYNVPTYLRNKKNNQGN